MELLENIIKYRWVSHSAADFHFPEPYRSNRLENSSIDKVPQIDARSEAFLSRLPSSLLLSLTSLFLQRIVMLRDMGMIMVFSLTAFNLRAQCSSPSGQAFHC